MHRRVPTPPTDRSRPSGRRATGVLLAVVALVAAPLVAVAVPAPSIAAAPAAPVQLDRTGWSVTATSEGFGYPAAYLLDGNLSTLWSSGNGQTPGQRLTLDLGHVDAFDTIELALGSATNDWARAWSVSWSTDGTAYGTAVTGTGSAADGLQEIALGQTASGRYVRIEQTSGHFINAWSAAELNLTRAATVEADYPDFGPNVTIIDPSWSSSQIQSTLDGYATSLETAEFSDARRAVLFMPGEYTVDSKLGYYTTVAGLGETPDDVRITGGIRTEGRIGNPPWTDDALVNFWRSLENVAIDPTNGEERWAVSQASPLRRVHIEGALALNPLYWGYSSGGFIADSAVDGNVQSGPQQQWYTRDSDLGSWTGSVWNQVFSGVTNAPDDAAYPSPPMTTIDTTPVSREKPFLYVDDDGDWNVFHPAVRTDSASTTWSDGLGAGESIPLSDFFIAQPDDDAATIDAALADGKDLILTPGVYALDDTIRVERPDTVVLGMGMATLVAPAGKPAITVADVDGVALAGIIVDAGTGSDTLVTVGSTGGVDHAADPTTLSDVFFRVGGARAGSATTSLQVGSDDVILDDIWAWRADHGAGVGWDANRGDHGVVVDGDDVTATGLFVEHYQQNQVLWNGERGRTIFYQSELPYDPPTQDAWKDGDVSGYASYRVADDVQQHEADGLGVYSYFIAGPAIEEASAIRVPTTAGVTVHHAVSVFLAGNGSIAHTVNGAGTTVQSGAMTSYVADYPGLDTTPPTVALGLQPATPDGTDGWYVSPVTASGSGADDFLPAPTVEVSADSGSWSADPITVGDGVHELRARATDAAGNTGDTTATVQVDATAPSASASLAGAAVTVIATDATSGVAEIETADTAAGPWTTYTGAVALAAGQTLYYRALDHAGNASGVGAVTAPASPVPGTTAPPTTEAPVIALASPSTIVGTARVGSALTARPGAWTPGVTLAVQWRRDGVAIAHAQSASYVPTAADRGHRLSVVVTGSLSGAASVSSVSASTAKVAAGVIAKHPRPRIAGSVRVGKTLHAKVGSWSSGVKNAYRWLRDGKPIAGATHATYRLRAADAGHRITLRVTGTKAGYAIRVETSARTKRVVR